VRVCFALAIAVVCVVAAVAHAGASSAKVELRGVADFKSPSGNIECEVWDRILQGSLLRHAYCQTWKPNQSVTLWATGRLKICRYGACQGNAGDTTLPVLHYGQSIRVGHFRCTSFRLSGIRCVVRATGRGFQIPRQGIKTVG
jgi:hypothetical protein